MLRLMFNLLLVLIISFSASTIPINTSLSTLPKYTESFFPLKKSSGNNETIDSQYQLNFNGDYIYNPTNIEFTMSGNLNKEKLILGEDHQIILEIYREDNLLGKYFDNEIVKSIKSSTDNSIKYLLDISQDNLSLKNGYYSLKIYSTLEKFSNISPVEIKAVYLNDTVYIPAEDRVEKGYMYLTLYFPDKEYYQYLVPVSRKVPYTNKTIRTTINNLQEGPHPSLGLSEGSPIPKIPYIWVRGTTALLNLPKDIGIYDQGSAVSNFALNSLINSVTSIYGIDRVKFLVDGKEAESAFHGTYIKEPFERDSSPKAYLALETGTERFLLVPVKIENDVEDMDRLIAEMFNSLKTCIINGYLHENLTPTIPYNIKLVDYKVEEDTLTLTFSEDFIKAYPTREDIQRMIIDSILYSFASIPEINKVAIKINGNEEVLISGIDVSQPMSPPNYINIEE